MYSARNLEDAMQAPEETAELHLSGRGFGEFPREIFSLPNLRVLDLSQNLIARFPEDIGQLAKLEVLNLRHNALRTVPQEIGQLQHLIKLDLEKNQLNALPAELQHCEALRDLRLSHNSFEQWPAEALSPRLESLSISRNALRSIPERIRHLVQLKYLDLSFNRLRNLPGSLILIESLIHLQLEGNPLALVIAHAHPEEELARMMRDLRKSKAASSERLRWFRLLQGDESLLQEEAHYQLATALDSPIAQVRQAALQLLPTWFPSPLPEKGPAELVFAGTVTGKLKYQKALQAADFEIYTRAASGSIVVLGERPGSQGQQAFADGNPIAYPAHLEAWLKAAQGEFLSGKSESHPMTESLRRLIKSYRKENIEMAMVMMSRAGIPKELLTEMLAIRLFHADEELKGKAAEAFDTLAEKQLRSFVERQMSQYGLPEGGYSLQPLVEGLMRHAGLDAATLVDAAVTLGHGNLGLVMLLPELDRLPLLQKFLKEGQLNLSNLQLQAFPVALAQLSDLRYLMLSRNQLSALPEDLSAFAKLEMLDLAENQLAALPESIAALRQLTGLDLSQNRLHHLPEAIALLPKLEALRLDRNPLQDLPESLMAMPQLEMLGLFGCKFPQFPAQVWELSSLRSLDLGECNLSSLPATIQGFPKLESLGLRDNAIQDLPNWIGELPALRFLDLSLLPARQLPASLSGHARLERIYLIRDESMDWEQVVPILASMPRLKYVYLRGRKIVRAIQLHIEDHLPGVRVIWNG